MWNSRIQGGYTLVELVAVMVIVVVLAAYAIPRMLGANDFAAKVTADRVLAALHYAQTLAQRQGVATDVEVTSTPNRLAVKQGGTAVTFSTQNYDGTDTGSKYDVKLSSDAVIAPSGTTTITYGTDGIPTTAGLPSSITITGSGMTFSIKVEVTGFAHFE